MTLVTFHKGGSIPKTSLGKPGMCVLLGVTSEATAAGHSRRQVEATGPNLPSML